MNRQIESMTKCRIGVHNIRVWRTAESLAEAASHDDRIFQDVRGSNQVEIAEWLAGQPKVAAVEVVDDFGCGVLIYPDWP